MLIEPAKMVGKPGGIGEQPNQVQDVESDNYYRIEPDPWSNPLKHTQVARVTLVVAIRST